MLKAEGLSKAELAYKRHGSPQAAIGNFELRESVSRDLTALGGNISICCGIMGRIAWPSLCRLCSGDMLWIDSHAPPYRAFRIIQRHDRLFHSMLGYFLASLFGFTKGVYQTHNSSRRAAPA